MSNLIVIRMPKRFDYSSGAEFNVQVSKALEGVGNIALDCTDLEYIDSAGIGLLVMAQKKAASRQSKVLMKNLKAAPREILQLANLKKIIDIE
jgi:anti-anti-sigma factor